jgi:putative endonuclease
MDQPRRCEGVPRDTGSVRDGYVYILSNDTHRLYIGATNDLPKRVMEHRLRLHPHAFTARYTYDRLVYYEVFPSVEQALEREKQLKGWRRSKKVALIQGVNPAMARSLQVVS